MTNEPYNFSTTATGLMFLSALIGSIFGYFTGVFADTVVVFLARRNGGVKEPETRLWTLCLSFVYAGLGYLLYGWAADSGLPWIAVPKSSQRYCLRAAAVRATPLGPVRTSAPEQGFDPRSPAVLPLRVSP